MQTASDLPLAIEETRRAPVDPCDGRGQGVPDLDDTYWLTVGRGDGAVDAGRRAAPPPVSQLRAGLSARRAQQASPSSAERRKPSDDGSGRAAGLDLESRRRVSEIARALPGHTSSSTL
jgi:hypothetical protein